MKYLFYPLLLLSLVALHPPASGAADPFQAGTDPFKEGGAQMGAPEKAPEEKNATFDLQFGGGTFDELLQSIARASGRTPNVIVSRRAQDFELPSFELYSVTLDGVFDALSELLRAYPAPGEEIRMYRTRPGIWIVELNPRGAVPEATRVFQVGSYLTDFRLEDITTAIETAWEMAGLEEDGRLRFHEETRLLYARGTTEQIELIEQVLEQMGAQLQNLRRDREALAEIEARLNVRLEEADRALEQTPALLAKFRELFGGDDRAVEDLEEVVEWLELHRDRLVELREQFGGRNPMVAERVDTLERMLQSWRSVTHTLRRKEEAELAGGPTQERMENLAQEIERRREMRRQIVEEREHSETR